MLYGRRTASSCARARILPGRTVPELKFSQRSALERTARVIARSAWKTGPALAPFVLTQPFVCYIVNPMVKYSDRLDEVFAALSDPTRRHIVERLARADELTAGAIAADFSISLPAVSKHLKVLERCGLLRRKVVGREHHCRLNPRAMRRAATWLEAQERFWNASFDKLDELLSRTAE